MWWDVLRCLEMSWHVFSLSRTSNEKCRKSPQTRPRWAQGSGCRFLLKTIHFLVKVNVRYDNASKLGCPIFFKDKPILGQTHRPVYSCLPLWGLVYPNWSLFVCPCRKRLNLMKTKPWLYSTFAACGLGCGSVWNRLFLGKSWTSMRLSSWKGPLAGNQT